MFIAREEDEDVNTGGVRADIIVNFKERFIDDLTGMIMFYIMENF